MLFSHISNLLSHKVLCYMLHRQFISKSRLTHLLSIDGMTSQKWNMWSNSRMLSIVLPYVCDRIPVWKKTSKLMKLARCTWKIGWWKSTKGSFSYKLLTIFSRKNESWRLHLYGENRGRFIEKRALRAILIDFDRF